MILNFDFDFLVKLHLDDVLEVVLVVRGEFLSCKTCMYINTKGRFTEKSYDDWFINGRDI